MLEFPGPVVNRKVHTVYGVDVTQCAAVPFAKRSPPGQALKMGFFSDEFVQRRGFSCQVWGESVPGPVPGLEEYESGPSGSSDTGGQQHQQHQQQHQHQQHHHQQQQQQQHQQQQQQQQQQQRPQILQHQFQPETTQQQQHFPQQAFNQHPGHQQQFQQQPFQPQQFQQPFQQQHSQQQEFQQQEQFQPQQQEFKEQQQQQPPNTQSLITDGFQQVLPLLNIPGYRRPSPGGGNPPAPPRRPNIGALQGLASLFVPYSAPRQSRPSRPPLGLRGSRGGPRNPRRLRRPRQRIAYRQPAGHVRFPGRVRRRRRSLAELLKARILSGGGGSDIQSIATTTAASPSVLNESSEWNAVLTNEAPSQVKPNPSSKPSDVFRPHENNGFTPPEKFEYIFTPVRFPLPFDPDRKAPPAFYRRERVTVTPPSLR